MVVLKKHVTGESNRVLAAMAMEKQTAPIQPDVESEARKLAGEMRKVAEQLTYSVQKGSGLVKDVDVCLGAVAAERAGHGHGETDGPDRGEEVQNAGRGDEESR